MEVKTNSIFARFERYGEELTRKRMAVVGHLIVHTRQMDMVMYNDKMVDWYYKDMVKTMESSLDVEAKDR